MSEEAIIARGREAKQLMEHPLLREATLEYEKTVTRAWVEGKTVADRESAHAEIRALHGMLRRLRTIMDRGVVSELEAQKVERLAAQKAPRKP